MTAVGCAVCGTAVCSTCDRGDRHASLCAEHDDVTLLQGWAEVTRTTHEPEAELLAEGLRMSGVEAFVLSQKDHAHMLAVGGMAVVRVLVPAWRYTDALALLADGPSSHGEPTSADGPVS